MEKEDLWVIFKLAGDLYAVNSCCIEGIAREPEQITGVPEAEDYVRGIVKQRGKITTLIDLRKVFGIKSTLQEYDDFASVMEKAKTAHRKWVNELLKCVDEQCHFCMEKDPHRCDFGLWYDKYEPPVAAVRKSLDKIRAPHNRLHQLGKRYDQELLKSNAGSGEFNQISEEVKVIEKEILQCMDETKQHFNENNRTMMITVKLKNDQNLALIVDEIVKVEQIGQVYQDTTLEKMEHSELIGNVASTLDGKELLLLIDEDEIYHMLTESALSNKDQTLAV